LHIIITRNNLAYILLFIDKEDGAGKMMLHKSIYGEVQNGSLISTYYIFYFYFSESHYPESKTLTRRKAT